MFYEGKVMKRNSIAVLLLLSTASTATLANDDFIKLLDEKITTCTSNAENTLATVDCYNTGLRSWDSELNKQYKLLLSEQSDEFKASLRRSQSSWIKYRDLYIEAMGEYYKQQGGTIWGVVLSEAKVRITRDKAIELYKLRTSTDLS